MKIYNTYTQTKFGFKIWVILWVLVVQLLHSAFGVCSWPSEFQSSQWYDSGRGVVTFGVSDLQGWRFRYNTNLETDAWTCVSVQTYDTDGRIIMVTSNKIQLFGTNYYAYVCMTVSRVTDSSYMYYLDQAEMQNVFGERVFIYQVNTITDPGTLCSDTSGATGGEYHMMLEIGKESEAKVNCPYSFLGRHGYNHTTSMLTTTCDTMTSRLDTCADTQEMKFNYTTCPTKVAYSSSDTVWCVNNVPVGDVNYVMLYNGNDASTSIDDVTNFRFSCMAISGDGLQASVSPRHCQEGQLPGTLPQLATNLVTGAVLKLTNNNDTCPTCPILDDPALGSVTISTSGAVTSAEYTCSTNYTLWGSDTRTCQSDNTWSNQQPYCNCARPPTPTNGSVSVNSDGTIATYTCSTGTSINGLASRACQVSTSTWEGSDPMCVQCSPLQSITGQSFIRSSNGTVTSASFTCAPGYTLNGSLTMTCGPLGTWNTQQPLCTSCALLTNPASGHVQLTSDGSVTTASYNCSQGYNLQGDVSRVCGVDGTWTGATPTCLCDNPAGPTNGAVVADGVDATYTCNLGFTISGPATRMCQGDSTGWDGSNPTCSLCSTLPAVTGGQLSLSTTGTVTSARYSCEAGYSLNGVTPITCEASGSWNNVAPTCVECLPLTNPTSGTVTLSTSGTRTTATYACASGYSLTGNAITLCNNDGTWTLPAPTCTCQDPPAPSNGAVTSDGSVATFTCNLGYTLNGVHTTSCATDGTGWTWFPTCTICATLTFPTGGTVVKITDGINTRAEFTCDPGYTLNGVAQLTCRSDGTWDYSQPSCTKCPDLTDPSSGSVTIATNGNTTTATFACQTGYYISGQYLLSCKTDGTWSDVIPTCKCNFPMTPNHGAVSVSDGSSGTVATYSCDTGYSLSGLTSRRCQTDGSGWEGTDPTCTVCQTVTSPVSGAFTLATNDTHTSVSFTCDVMTTLAGSQQLLCQSDGTWDHTEPNCVSCIGLSTSGSGVINYDSDGQRTVATFACVPGYSLNSTSTLTCNTDGTWNLPSPVCICQAPPPVSNGEYVISTDLTTVTYTCQLGYSLAGLTTRTCMNDGTGWTGISPTCEQDESPDTGAATSDDNNNNNAYVISVIIVSILFVVVAIILILFIHLYCRLKNEKSSRIHSAVTRTPDMPEDKAPEEPELLPAPPPTDKKSSTFGQKYQNSNERPISPITATDVSLPNLSERTPRSPKNANGKVPLTAVRLPKLSSRPPAGHELDTARRGQRRNNKPARPNGPPPVRPKTPIERQDMLRTPDLLSAAEFGYIRPQYCHEEGPPPLAKECKPKKKGKRTKHKKHPKDIESDLVYRETVHLTREPELTEITN